MAAKKKKVCEVCGGMGQISFFKGVSRFLLSSEECETCAGTGYILEVAKDKVKKTASRKSKKRKPDK
jgi:DnaJ-class molecular chaperone